MARRSNTLRFTVTALAIALVAVASVAIPLYVIRPFVPQNPHALVLALELRRIAAVLTLICVLGIVLLAVAAWKRTRRGARITFGLALVIAAFSMAASRVNIFERMFHPNPAPSFAPATQGAVDGSDMVLAVRVRDERRAYPIRYLGYHHIINDTVGGQPIAITYCTLCHTGLVWSRVLDGRTLYFHLGGINNGNALLRDAETSSIWQQSTGECIFGPLRGRRLRLISSSELSFALWRGESPKGTVLRPDSAVESEYDPKDWEQHVERTRVVVDVSSSGINPHEIIFGVNTNGHHRAYRLRSLYESHLIEDAPVNSADSILLALGPDDMSIRAFAPGQLTFVRAQNPTDQEFMTDTETGSTWSFEGCAVAGRLAGQCLKAVDGHKSFWFDWWNHYRDTTLYRG